MLYLLRKAFAASLAVLAFALGASVSSAQTPQLRQTSEDTFEFSYSEGILATNFGFNTPGATQACMKLDNPLLKGMTVVGVRVPKFNVTTQDVDWSKVWISSSLNRIHDIAECDGQFNDDGSFTGYFSDGYIIGEEPVYVGYTLDIPDIKSSYNAGKPVGLGYPSLLQGVSYVSTGTEEEFTEYSSIGTLNAIVLLKKNQIPANQLELEKILSVPVVGEGKSLRLVAQVANYGTATAEDVAYELKINGQTLEGKADTPNPLVSGVHGRSEIAIDLPVIKNPGSYHATLSIPMVNGVENVASSKSLDFDLNVIGNSDTTSLKTATPMKLCAGEPVMYMGIGLQNRGFLEQAVRICDPTATGMKVVGIKVAHVGYNGTGNYNAWTSKELTNNPDGGRNYGTVDANGNLVVMFPNPVEVTDEGIYVGYTMDILYPDDSWAQAGGMAGPLPIDMSGTVQPNTCFMNYQGAQWMDYAKRGYGNTITVYLDGSMKPDNMVIGEMTSYPVVLKDTPISFNFTVANCGSNEINSFEYAYTVDGITQEQTVNLDEPMKYEVGKSHSVALDLGKISNQGKHDATIKITKVNGKDNVQAEKAVTATVSVLDYAPTHRPLMEEITGTWCGWCPRGAIGMRELKKIYPDFIGVAYHDTDEFTVTRQYPWEAYSLPGCTMDRSTANIDPYYGIGKNEFGIKDVYDDVRSCAAPCDIELSTSWANEEHTQLDADVTLTFALDDPSADYKIGYMLVGEKYCFPDDESITQNNNFAGSKDYGNSVLDELTKQPKYIAGFEWDNVVIEVSDILGVEGSVPTSVSLNVPVTHSKRFETGSILSNAEMELAEDKDNLAVVAYVVNDKGRVVNAAIAHAGSSGISALNYRESIAECTYYDIMGRQVAHPQNGIFIRVVNGKASKIRM